MIHSRGKGKNDFPVGVMDNMQIKIHIRLCAEANQQKNCTLGTILDKMVRELRLFQKLVHS
jgi:hypothetical protein